MPNDRLTLTTAEHPATTSDVPGTQSKPKFVKPELAKQGKFTEVTGFFQSFDE